MLWKYLKTSHKRIASLQEARAPEGTDYSCWSCVLILGTGLGGCWLTTEYWEIQMREQ